MKFEANTVFKSLRGDLGSHHHFPLPGQWKNGAWVGPVSQDEKELKAHSWGLHLAKKDYLIYWLGARNFIAEYKGDAAETRDVVAAEYARLVREIGFSNESIASLAVTYCEPVRDLGATLEFDWSIARTMQTSFDLSREFLKAGGKADGKDARALAALCGWNARLREQDARNSFQYVHGCRAVMHASHALSLLPKIGDDNIQNILLLKQVAYDVRMAVSLAVEEHYYRADINGAEYRPLPVSLVKWVEAASDLQPQHAAFDTVAKWQNRLLLKKAEPLS